MSQNDDTTILKKIKKLLKDKGVLYEEEINNIIKDKSPNDKRYILSLLEEDGAIGKIGDMYRYSKTRSGKDPLLDVLMLTEKVEAKRNYVKFGNLYVKGLTVPAYPKESDGDFLQPILAEKKNVDITLDINIASRHNLMSFFKRKVQEIEAKINVKMEIGHKSTELEQEKLVYEKKLKELEGEKTKLFTLSTFILVRGSNEEELNSSAQKINTLMRANKIIVKSTTNYHLESLKTTAPLGANYLRRREILTTNQLLSRIFPFIEVVGE